MIITVANKELDFTKDDSGLWSATLIYDDYELDFEFSESIFVHSDSVALLIDWDLITYFVTSTLKNLEIIQTKGSLVLEELHRQIFGEDELYKTKGYFKVGGMTLQSYIKLPLKGIDIELIQHPDSPFVRYNFTFETFYFQESANDMRTDAYHSYYAQFIYDRKNLTLVGVFRK